MKYALRFLGFLLKKGILLLLILGVCVTAFISASNISNMFILISDGMELRAATILGVKGGAQLSKYFSRDFLDNDEMLLESPYVPYKISGFSYTPSFQWLWAWPWQTTATATVEEKVVLEGYLRLEYQTPEQLASTEKFPAPLWQNACYSVTLRKQSNGSWIITRMVKTADRPEATVRPNLVQP